LENVFLVPHAHVQQHIARWSARFSLEAHTHPAVGVVGSLEAFGRDGVGENEERGALSARGGQALDQ
jgi:hypothetical protein